MWTPTLRKSLVAWGLACVLGAAPEQLAAQKDTMSFPRGVVGAAWGAGSLSVDCEACSDHSGGSVDFLEGKLGVDLTRSVGVLLTGALSGARSDEFKGGAGWWLVGVRFRAGVSGRFFVQAAAGKAGVDLERRIGEDTGLCHLIFGDCWDVEVHEVSGPVYQLALGFELPLSRHVAITPQLQALAGRVTMTGLSLGISGFARNQ